MKKTFGTAVALACTLFLPSAAQVAHAQTPQTPQTPQTQQVQQAPGQDARSVIGTAKTIQTLLASRRYGDLVAYIHPAKGVRFSMSEYVDAESDKLFGRRDFATYLAKPAIRFTWGHMGESDDKLVTSLPNYLDTKVKAAQFNQSKMTLNRRQGGPSATVGNFEEVYPDADFVDFYSCNGCTTEADRDYQWRGLRLVFEQYQGSPHLVAVISMAHE